LCDNDRMNDDPASLTIEPALELRRSGNLTADALAEICYSQIERLNPELNAFILVRPRAEATLAGSGTAAQRPARLATPLENIPLAVKDLYDLAGVPTTAGTSFFKDTVVEEDAAVVRRLKAAGAIIIGKTNTHEIAYGVTGINPHFGACRNPWDVARIAGGSSSGSAVAVATGMCLGALGTDTGGSIRIPAALCGIVGLKPSLGRVSLRGVFPLSWNLDHAGPLTRSVRDAAMLLQVMAGYDPEDPASVNMAGDDYLKDIEGGVRGWRVAVAGGDYFEALDADVAEAFEEAVGIFPELGAEVMRVDLAYLREAASANGVMIGADAAAFHRDRLETNPEGFGADVRQRLEIGKKRTGPEYALARRVQSEMIRRMDSLFAEYDILLTPTVPVAAPVIEGADALAQAGRLTRFTAPFNLTGLPALSLPCGFTRERLPVGLQIVSGRWSEAKVLRAGKAYESQTKWHEERPPLTRLLT
jgi:aspartyl-tRNA(Asn)/glutamyl-tRNA(Gln) amidotransferase subunit A